MANTNALGHQQGDGLRKLDIQLLYSFCNSVPSISKLWSILERNREKTHSETAFHEHCRLKLLCSPLLPFLHHIIQVDFSDEPASQENIKSFNHVKGRILGLFQVPSSDEFDFVLPQLRCKCCHLNRPFQIETWLTDPKHRLNQNKDSMDVDNTTSSNTDTGQGELKTSNLSTSNQLVWNFLQDLILSESSIFYSNTFNSSPKSLHSTTAQHPFSTKIHQLILQSIQSLLTFPIHSQSLLASFMCRTLIIQQITLVVIQVISNLLKEYANFWKIFLQTDSSRDSISFALMVIGRTKQNISNEMDVDDSQLSDEEMRKFAFFACSWFTESLLHSLVHYNFSHASKRMESHRSQIYLGIERFLNDPDFIVTTCTMIMLNSTVSAALGTARRGVDWLSVLMRRFSSYISSNSEILKSVSPNKRSWNPFEQRYVTEFHLTRSNPLFNPIEQIRLQANDSEFNSSQPNVIDWLDRSMGPKEEGKWVFPSKPFSTLSSKVLCSLMQFLTPPEEKHAASTSFIQLQSLSSHSLPSCLFLEELGLCAKLLKELLHTMDSYAILIPIQFYLIGVLSKPTLSITQWSSSLKATPEEAEVNFSKHLSIVTFRNIKAEPGASFRQSQWAHFLKTMRNVDKGSKSDFEKACFAASISDFFSRDPSPICSHRVYEECSKSFHTSISSLYTLLTGTSTEQNYGSILDISKIFIPEHCTYLILSRILPNHGTDISTFEYPSLSEGNELIQLVMSSLSSPTDHTFSKSILITESHELSDNELINLTCLLLSGCSAISHLPSFLSSFYALEHDSLTNQGELNSPQILITRLLRTTIQLCKIAVILFGKSKSRVQFDLPHTLHQLIVSFSISAIILTCQHFYYSIQSSVSPSLASTNSVLSIIDLVSVILTSINDVAQSFQNQTDYIFPVLYFDNITYWLKEALLLMLHQQFLEFCAFASSSNICLHQEMCSKIRSASPTDSQSDEKEPRQSVERNNSKSEEQAIQEHHRHHDTLPLVVYPSTVVPQLTHLTTRCNQWFSLSSFDPQFIRSSHCQILDLSRILENQQSFTQNQTKTSDQHQSSDEIVKKLQEQALRLLPSSLSLPPSLERNSLRSHHSFDLLSLIISCRDVITSTAKSPKSEELDIPFESFIHAIEINLQSTLLFIGNEQESSLKYPFRNLKLHGLLLWLTYYMNVDEPKSPSDALSTDASAQVTELIQEHLQEICYELETTDSSKIPAALFTLVHYFVSLVNSKILPFFTAYPKLYSTKLGNYPTLATTLYYYALLLLYKLESNNSHTVGIQPAIILQPDDSLSDTQTFSSQGQSFNQNSHTTTDAEDIEDLERKSSQNGGIDWKLSSSSLPYRPRHRKSLDASMIPHPMYSTDSGNEHSSLSSNTDQTSMDGMTASAQTSEFSSLDTSTTSISNSMDSTTTVTNTMDGTIFGPASTTTRQLHQDFYATPSLPALNPIPPNGATESTPSGVSTYPAPSTTKPKPSIVFKTHSNVKVDAARMETTASVPPSDASQLSSKHSPSLTTTSSSSSSSSLVPTDVSTSERMDQTFKTKFADSTTLRLISTQPSLHPKSTTPQRRSIFRPDFAAFAKDKRLEDDVSNHKATSPFLGSHPSHNGLLQPSDTLSDGVHGEQSSLNTLSMNGSATHPASHVAAHIKSLQQRKNSSMKVDQSLPFSIGSQSSAAMIPPILHAALTVSSTKEKPDPGAASLLKPSISHPSSSSNSMDIDKKELGSQSTECVRDLKRQSTRQPSSITAAPHGQPHSHYSKFPSIYTPGLTNNHPQPHQNGLRKIFEYPFDKLVSSSDLMLDSLIAVAMKSLDLQVDGPILSIKSALSFKQANQSTAAKSAFVFSLIKPESSSSHGNLLNSSSNSLFSQFVQLLISYEPSYYDLLVFVLREKKKQLEASMPLPAHTDQFGICILDSMKSFKSHPVWTCSLNLCTFRNSFLSSLGLHAPSNHEDSVTHLLQQNSAFRDCTVDISKIWRWNQGEKPSFDLSAWKSLQKLLFLMIYTPLHPQDPLHESPQFKINFQQQMDVVWKIRNLLAGGDRMERIIAVLASSMLHNSDKLNPSNEIQSLPLHSTGTLDEIITGIDESLRKDFLQLLDWSVLQKSKNAPIIFHSLFFLVLSYYRSYSLRDTSRSMRHRLQSQQGGAAAAIQNNRSESNPILLNFQIATSLVIARCLIDWLNEIISRNDVDQNGAGPTTKPSNWQNNCNNSCLGFESVNAASLSLSFSIDSILKYLHALFIEEDQYLMHSLFTAGQIPLLVLDYLMAHVPSMHYVSEILPFCLSIVHKYLYISSSTSTTPPASNSAISIFSPLGTVTSSSTNSFHSGIGSKHNNFKQNTLSQSTIERNCDIGYVAYFFKLTSLTVTKYPTEKNYAFCANIMKMFTHLQPSMVSPEVWRIALPHLTTICQVFPQLCSPFFTATALSDSPLPISSQELSSAISKMLGQIQSDPVFFVDC